MTSDTTDLLQVIEEEVRAAFVFAGVEAGQVWAGMVVGRVCSRYGGRMMYVRSQSQLEKDRLHEEARQRFTGNNYPEIARALGISVRHARRILHRKP